MLSAGIWLAGDSYQRLPMLVAAGANAGWRDGMASVKRRIRR
ncbi:hypothetical protein DDI_1712 [Dickeya dianthicola RNS04.9]|nr:hypothetical protein DDI_1712 [Dickeya dianthicola RNS04.9]